MIPKSFTTEILTIPFFAKRFWGAFLKSSVGDCYNNPWNYNANRNNMLENSLLYARLSLHVVNC